MPYADKSHPNNKRIRAESLIRQRAREPIRHSIRQAYYSAKTRCNKSGVPFDILMSDVTHNLETCALSGIPFKRGSEGKVSPYSPSIDRIDPTKGYTRGNVRVILHAINAFKGQMSDEEVLIMAKAIVEYANEH